MALQIRFLPPTDPTPLASAYVRLTVLAVDDGTKAGRVSFAVFRSKEAADAGCQPTGVYDFAIPREAISEQPAVLDTQGNVVRAAVPRFPGYDEFFTASGIGDQIKGMLYRFFKTRPEFAGAEDV